MDKKTLNAMWGHMRQVYGVGLRVVEAIPADKIDSTPIPRMRTPKQLVVHTYAMCTREMTEGVLRGKINQIDEKPICDSIKTHADLVKFCKEQFAAADKNVSRMTDANLASIVKTPWNFEAPGYEMIGIIHDEYIHHRGQLYAYLRTLGQDVPMMWDFEHNAPEYQPNQSAKA